MSLKKTYWQTIVKDLQKQIGRKNIWSLPRLEKIMVNVGMGTYLKGEKSFEGITDGIMRVTAQKPVVKNARKSVSNFKLREGQANGAFVTLRRDRMYDFLDRLVNIVFPRIRDFRGFSSKSFDGHGNYSLGIREHLIFPEIPTDDIVKSFGMQITFVTTTDDDKEAKLLLDAFGFPFKK